MLPFHASKSREQNKGIDYEKLDFRQIVPAKLIFITNIKRFSKVLENKLVKRKNKFPTLTLKFKEKGVYANFIFI